VSEEEDDGGARDSDSDGYDECLRDAMGGGGGGGGGEEMMDDKENDAAAAAAAGAAPLYVGDVGDELDVQYKRLLQRYLLGNRSPYKVLLDELDIDVTLCEEEATSNAAANEGKKGYARPENALRKLKEMLDEIVNLELAMHRRHVNMRKPEDIFFNANKVHDGAVAESFNQMRHLLDLMLQHTETTIKMRRISSGVNVPMSLDELIRNYRSERNKQNATLKAITFFLEQAASRRLRKLRPESGKNEIYLYEPLVIDGYTTVSFSRVGTLDAWSVAAGGGGGGLKTNHHAGLPISCAPTAIPTSSTPSAQRRRRCPRPASELWFERLTFNSSYRKATRYLESTEDRRFPFYEVSEFVHGFENCYVDTMECRAYFYADNPQGTSRLVSRHHHAGVRLEKSWSVAISFVCSCMCD